MRRVATGPFELELPAAEAIGWFTPEGERAWVPGWEPVYATGDPGESSGTVFATISDGVKTIWLILHLDRAVGTAAYARITPNDHAGTAAVACVDTGTRRCVVSVTYDISLLPGGDAAVLEPFGQGAFDDVMEEWALAVRDHLDTRPGS